MSDRDATTNGERGTLYSIGELFCGEHNGIVSIHSRSQNEVMRLTLAAAEDLAFMLQYRAERGRAAAQTSGSSTEGGSR